MGEIQSGEQTLLGNALSLVLSRHRRMRIFITSLVLLFLGLACDQAGADNKPFGYGGLPYLDAHSKNVVKTEGRVSEIQRNDRAIVIEVNVASKFKGKFAEGQASIVIAHSLRTESDIQRLAGQLRESLPSAVLFLSGPLPFREMDYFRYKRRRDTEQVFKLVAGSLGAIPTFRDEQAIEIEKYYTSSQPIQRRAWAAEAIQSSDKKVQHWGLQELQKHLADDTVGCASVLASAFDRRVDPELYPMVAFQLRLAHLLSKNDESSTQVRQHCMSGLTAAMGNRDVPVGLQHRTFLVMPRRETLQHWKALVKKNPDLAKSRPAVMWLMQYYGTPDEARDDLLDLWQGGPDMRKRQWAQNIAEGREMGRALTAEESERIVEGFKSGDLAQRRDSFFKFRQLRPSVSAGELARAIVASEVTDSTKARIVDYVANWKAAEAVEVLTRIQADSELDKQTRLTATYALARMAEGVDEAKMAITTIANAKSNSSTKELARTLLRRLDRD